MFYKNNLFIAILTFTVFLMALFTNAQTIIVVLKQPPPNQWNVEDLWQLTLINTSQEESYNVYLYGTVEEADAGIIFEGTTTSFTLEPNYSGPVNPGDLEPVDVGYVNDDYEDIVQKTGTLPAGTYTICVYVKGVDGEVMGYDCKMQIIAHPSPPELINPADEANVTEELPVFLWLPPMPMGEFVTYNIKLVQCVDGQTPIEATEANPVWFEETGIFSTSFQFPISAREFEQGVTYAWYITAISGDALVIGESQVWSFNYGAAAVVLYEEPVSIELNYPIDGAVIDTTTPRFGWELIDTTTAVTVTWTVTPEVTYTLTIWQSTEDLAERVAGGYKLTEEDLSELEPYFVKEEIEETSFVYTDTTDYPLVPGFTYCWQVTAWSGELGIGRSEVNTFSLKTQEIGEIVLYHFIPDTLFSRTEPKATLVGKGFIEGMEFEVHYEGIDVVDAQFQDTEHYLIDFKIDLDVSPGHYMFTVTAPVKDIPRGKPPTTAVNVPDEGCKKILEEYNALKKENDKKAEECRKLEADIKALREKIAKAKKQIANFQKAKDALDNANQSLEDLINRAIGSNEVSTEYKDGLDNWIGLYDGQVRIYFSGTDASVDKILWFIDKYRDQWTKLRDECKKAAEELSKLKKDKEEAEKALKELKIKLKKLEEALKNCKKALKELDDKKKLLKEKESQCLKREAEQDTCKGKIKEAKRKCKDAEKKIAEAIKKIAKAKKKQNSLIDSCENAEKLIKKAEELLKQAIKDAQSQDSSIEKANKEYNKHACLKNAEEHAATAEAEAERALKKAEASSDIAEAADSVITECERAEAARKAEEELIKQREKEKLEWWEEFLTHDNPTPHSIIGGKENLAIRLAHLLNRHIMDKMENSNFTGETCQDKCLIAVQNIFEEQWMELLKNLGWDVFLSSIQLPSLITEMSIRASFMILKGIIGKLVKSPNVIPLWGKYKYKHDYTIFKHLYVGKFECDIESYLTYNKKTGYVSGAVLCKCCGTVQMLYIKYKCDKYGRALSDPLPRIEFR